MVFTGSKLVVWRLFVFCEKKLYKARLFVKFCQGFFYTRICPSLIMVFFYAFKTIFLNVLQRKIWESGCFYVAFFENEVQTCEMVF